MLKRPLKMTLAALSVFGILASVAGCHAAPTALQKTLDASADAAWSPAPSPLTTRWAKDVDPTRPLPDYPRPQMTRARWQSLNGLWDYALTDASVTDAPGANDGQILVPFPYESALSGVGKPSIPNKCLWYRRSFAVPAAWRTGGQRVLLHFGAVNWNATVMVNGQTMGEHKGGYDPFDFDITSALKAGENSITVAVRNPLVSDTPDAQIIGKQRIQPISVLYTASTGIWQTVWIEPVPAMHIAGLKITPDIDAKLMRVTVQMTGAETGVPVTVAVMDGALPIAHVTGKANTLLSVPVIAPHLWSPSDPHLYTLHVALGGAGGDTVDSYAAMRKVSLGKDDQGRTCIFLNNKQVFEVGALDQGYWPDGLYTAPTDAALRADIVMAKKFGFNLLRKHAKVEPERWYYWTDRLGMLVWQDMPQAFGTDFTDATKAQWLVEMQRMFATHDNHPSIIVWTLFNEGWGQHDTEEITALARRLDPTRLLNAASGGYNQDIDGKMSTYRLPTPASIGDINDDHTYPDPTTEKSDPSRALVCGEFGGVSMRVQDHVWSAGNFGYGTAIHDGWHLTQRYQQLLQEAYRLHADTGASAVVYTQIADVENETNGLMTYDRAVIKPLPEYIAAANQGESPALPPAPLPPVSHDPVPTSQIMPQVWSYTTVKPADDWNQIGFDAGAWKSGPAPFGQGYTVNTPWTDTPGDIWLRRTVALPAALPARLVVRTIHDEDVEVYVNGVLAASAPGYVGDYVDLPMSEAARAALKPGAQDVIAVHCHQTIGGQVIDVGIATNSDAPAASTGAAPGITLDPSAQNGK